MINLTERERERDTTLETEESSGSLLEGGRTATKAMSSIALSVWIWSTEERRMRRGLLKLFFY